MSWCLVFARSVVAGTLLGAAVGGCFVLFFAWPGALMPYFGGIASVAMGGGLVGAGLGVVDGSLRATVATSLRPSLAAIRALAALTYAPVGGFLGSVGGWPVGLGCALAAGAIGAFVGPLTAYGVRLDPAQRWWWRSSLVLLAAVTVGGALLGLVIGLATYWPTALFALIEGAYIGAGCGMVTVVLLSVVWLPFLRPDVP